MTGRGPAIPPASGTASGQGSAPESAPGQGTQQEAVRFADIQRVLGVFAHGIAGRHLHLAAIEEPGAAGVVRGRGPSTDPGGIRLPAEIADFASGRHNRAAYRIAVLHQIGYLEFGTFDFDLATAESLGLTGVMPARTFLGSAPPRPGADLERFLSSAPASSSAAVFSPAMLRRVFMTLEDLRIDSSIRRRYPGAVRDLELVLGHARMTLPRSEPGGGAVWALLESLALYSLGADGAELLAFDGSGHAKTVLGLAGFVEAVGADVYDTARAALTICSLLASLMATAAEATAAQSPSADDPQIEEPLPGEGVSDKAGGSLMDEERDGVAEPSDHEVDAPGLDFRGEVLPDLVDRQGAAGQFGSLADEQPSIAKVEADGPHDGNDKAEAERRARKLARRPTAARVATFDGQSSFLYDEWDYRNGRYLTTWCRVQEHRLRGADGAFISGVRRRHSVLVSQVKRRFTFIKPESWRRVHRTSDGDELGIDAVIEAVIDRRAGYATDEHLYIRRDRSLREVAAAFLVDMSASTSTPVPDPDAVPEVPTPADDRSDPWEIPEYAPSPPPGRRVLDIAKDALALMCDALNTLGDGHAIYGFSGKGRENVEFHVAKEFSDRPSSRTWAALAAMEPRGYTRMGPAIRHTVTKLAAQSVRQKLLVIVSDGYPQDEDYGPERADSEYGLQDTARALQEAEQAGITTFCITIDPAGHDYLRRMCPEQRYMVIDDVHALPGELVKVYRALSRPSYAS